MKETARVMPEHNARSETSLSIHMTRRIDEDHRQGETRDNLGSSNHERKRTQKQEAFQNTTRGTFVLSEPYNDIREMRCTHAQGPGKRPHKGRQRHQRRKLCTWRIQSKQRTTSTVLHFRQPDGQESRSNIEGLPRRDLSCTHGATVPISASTRSPKHAPKGSFIFATKLKRTQKMQMRIRRIPETLRNKSDTHAVFVGKVTLL